MLRQSLIFLGVPRSDEDFQLLMTHYDAYDPSNPKSSAIGDGLLYETLGALGFPPDSFSEEISSKSSAERRDIYMKAMHKMVRWW